MLVVSVTALMRRAVPAARLSREATETMRDCASELISFVTSEGVPVQLELYITGHESSLERSTNESTLS